MNESLQGEMAEAYEGHWADELQDLPPRPRRRLLTPLTGALLAVLLAACGFVGGVLVEKGQTPSSSPAGFAARLTAGGGAGVRAAGEGRAGGFGGQSGPAGGQGGNFTVGQVSSVEGRTLYVTTPQGTIVRIKVPAGESVSRTTTASVHSIHPGDSVVVQGSKGTHGVIDATSVRATQATAGGGAGAGGAGGSGGGLLSQLFGGGGGG
jgi:hypothetical protein